MKNIFLSASLFAFLVFSTLTSYAQIPNADFENWTAGNPDQWVTSNDSTFLAIFQVNPAYSGASALEVDMVDVNGFILPGTLYSSFPENSTPGALHGWHKFNDEGGDAWQVLIGLYANSNLNGFAFETISTTVSVFEEFVIDITYTGASVDSATIEFTLTPAPGHLGSYLIIDDLSWGGGGSGISDDPSANAITLEGVYPNPAKNMTDVIYHLPVSADVHLAIYDLSGKEVKVLVNENQHPGRFKAQFDANELPAGLYICELKTGDTVQTMEVTVTK